MTKSIDNPSEPSPEPPNDDKKRGLIRLLRPSKKKAVGIIAIAGLGVVAYLGLDFWVKRSLPSIIQSQGSKLLNRPVEVGEVESFSLTGISLDSVSLPVTATDKDYVTIDEVKVGFNIFPVIFRRTLPLDITLMEPKVYLEQEADGSWLNLDLPEIEAGKSFISLDIRGNVEQGDITVVPYGKSPLNIQLNGKGRYNPEDKGQIQYDLEAAIAKAKATLQGETLLETGTTETKLLIKDLALTDVVSLVANSPVNLSQGVVNADLDVNIPSWEEFTSANVEGTLRVGEVKGDVASREIEGKSWLQFGGKNVEVKETQARVEDIQAQVSGEVDLQQGYNLDVAILPFDLATLPQTLATELPVPVTGEVKGDIQLRGDIKQPNITGSISNTKALTINKESLETVSANFSADLDKFTLQDLRIIPVVGGIVTVTGEISTNLQQSLENNQEIDITQMPLDFTLKADLPTEEIASPYYQLPENITVGNLNSEGTVTGTIADPQVLLQWRIKEGTTSGETIRGEGEVVLVDNNLLLQDTVVEVGEGKIDIEGTSNLEKQTWETAITVTSLNLTPFLSELQLKRINVNRPIAVNNANATLSGKLDAVSPDKIQGRASINLDVDNNPVNVASSISQGEINASANTGTIVLDQYISNLPTPVTIQSSQVNLISKIAPLLKETPDLSSVFTNINANLLVAEGSVTAQGSLQNNQWKGNIQGNNLKPSLLSPQLPANLDRVNTNIQVSGNIQPLITQQENVPIKVDKIIVVMGQQYLNATGDIVLSNLQTNPDIANVALAIDSGLNFNDLSLQDIIAGNNNQSLTIIPTIKGQAEFTGNLQGKNLISNPTQLGNLVLTGDITLNNFAINNTVFDPVMTGKVNIDPSERISVAIRGQEDIIAASAEPCVSSRCRFPYVPNLLNFRINENQDNSIIATGNRQEDIFNVNIANFPLTVLNITPAKPLGLDSPVGGIVTGDVAINLFSLGTKGNIAVARPGVGYIEAESFTADFDYNLDRNFAQVTTASLLLKDSEYNFNGDIDLNSGEIEGRLNIPQAYIQDILTTLGWYSIADAMNLFNNTELASPEVIEPRDMKTVGESISYKLQLLRNIEQQLQAIATSNRNSNIPTELDIKGGYTGEVLIAGNITNPEINFDINAQDWQWKPKATITTLVPSEGVVKQNNEVISLPQIQLEGYVKNKVLNLDIAKLQVEDAILSATGKLSPNQQDANFEVSNLTVDTISKFVTIPVDVTGTINTDGKLTGTLEQPKVAGNIVFADGTYNKQNLPDNIAGDYIYQNQKLNFNTTNPESIQITATVPYPIKPQVNDQLTADVKLTTEAFTLLGALTQNNLTWVGGEANAEIAAKAKINLNRDNPLYNVQATGEVNLNQAQVKTPNIKETITASGTLILHDQIIEVETLNGTLGNKDLSVTGKFPLLYTVNNLENPLTVNIPLGDIKLQGLYQGGIAGNIILTGTALEPVIGGKVALEDGKVSIIKNQVQKARKNFLETSNQDNNSNQNSDSNYQVLAKNFLVRLDNCGIQQQPLYDFKVSGELNLEGTLNNITQLKGEGTLKLVRADVDWLSNNFTLVRRRENLIVFNPEANITNPYLDIQLGSEVEELNRIPQLETGANEVPDDITNTNRTQTIDVRLSINGEVQDILPTITENTTNSCDIRPNNAVPLGNYTYSQTELDKLSNCVNFTAFEDRRDRQLLDSPAVSLSSNPERSEGQIINLLGNQFVSFAKQIEKSSPDELLELGFNQFIINPVERRFLYEQEDFVVGLGQNIGLDYLRVFPYIEAVYQLDNNFSLKGIYDPRLFTSQSDGTEANNTSEVFEIRLEYRLKF
ncbi:MAG: translocation/assembly module TamB domain-containing protein [Xenococcaceae cyanobacterium MO_207.B15]|nr:translocation/assembly module TamB domain-containing protein [Xenococcaceae cyanobacterium MO_207.B15]